MIICIAIDVDKVQIFSVGFISFIYLNDLYALNGSYVNDKSLVAITPNNKAFCLLYNI